MEDQPLATRVILVRHGETYFNAEGRVQGHIDESTLTEKGLMDAQRVGESLQGLPIHAIYTSPLKRAQQTGQTLWKTLQASLPIPQPQVADALIEVSLPLWEGMLFDEVKSRFPDQYHDWHHRPHQLRMAIPGPNGTSDFFPVRALYDQAGQLWQTVLPQHSGETILLVGHSGINRALIGTTLGVTPERYHTLQQANCNISILNFPTGEMQNVQLESLNQTKHLGLTLPKPRPTHAALRLLLVRHGETDWNRQGRFQGQIDVPLNETGRQQGQQVAHCLQDVKIDFAMSSPLKRPRETAEFILHYHPHVPLDCDNELREISHGTWEGRLEREIDAQYPGELERWRTTPEQVQMPEGENLQQVWERAIAAWDGLVKRALSQGNGSPQTGLVVAHDAINKVILCHVAGLGPDQFWSFKQGNGAVSVIDYSAEGVPLMQAMNITSHMQGGVLDQTAAGAL